MTNSPITKDLAPSTTVDPQRTAATTAHRRNTLDLCIDLDGCLYDFVAALRNWIHISTGRPLATMPDATTWNFYKDQWNMTTAEFLESYAAGVRARHIFTYGAADPEGVAVLNDLADQGHRLHIITARRIAGAELEAELATEAWLLREGIPFHTLNVVAGAKADTARRLTIDVAVDDAEHHYDELVDEFSPVLFSQPWNADHTGRRVDGWREFAAVVDDHATLIAAG